jgi:formylglycine-generating enzyme required for sulfatase activity
MGGHVFISYSHKDQAYARQLADDLRVRGFEVWMDDRIGFGSRWWQTIVEAIHGCAAMIVIMSPDAEESESVEREIQLALLEHKPVLPLLLRGTGFTYLVTRQYVQVTDGHMPPQTYYDRLRRVMLTPGSIESSAPEPEVPVTAAAGAPFEPEMVPIAAGDFTMGSDPQVDPSAEGSEQPQHILHLPAYAMARTPATNAQYDAFVQATAHRPPSHWANGRPPVGEDHHPVVQVTWHDAVAYCRWLSDVTGRTYRLPSEAEWEKGARGGDGRLYPWGERWEADRCNTAQSGTWTTTPVDAYPRGASPSGLLDMAGNVWEWTRSLYETYPYDSTDGREDLDVPGRRVLRGGSFGYKAALARSAYRLRFGPDNLGRDIGFRVVTSPATDQGNGRP